MEYTIHIYIYYMYICICKRMHIQRCHIRATKNTGRLYIHMRHGDGSQLKALHWELLSLLFVIFVATVCIKVHVYMDIWCTYVHMWICGYVDMCVWATVVTRRWRTQCVWYLLCWSSCYTCHVQRFTSTHLTYICMYIQASIHTNIPM